MGATNSTTGGSLFYDDSDSEKNLYDQYLVYSVLKNQPNSPAVVGGSVRKLGGLDGLENYANSVYAKSKEDVIRSIAKAIGPLIKYNKGGTDPIQKVVEELKKHVPTVSSGDRPIKSDKYGKFCEAIAKAINKEWKVDLIDIKAKPHVICEQVARMMESYFRGLDGEFMSVAGEVHKIIRNLEILQQLLDALHKKIFADLQSSPDSETAQQAEQVQALYNAAKNEIRRKLAILSNLINVNIGEVQGNLMDIFTDKKEFVGLTEDLEKSGIDSPQYGDVLANLVDGFSNIAYSANLVNDALKKLDIDFKDYKKVNSKSELQDLLYKSMVSKKYNSSDLMKMLELVKIVRENEENHDNIVEYLDNKVRGGAGLEYSGDDHTTVDSIANKTWQDTSKTPFDGRLNAPKSIGKQLYEQQKIRIMIMNDLNKQIKRHYLSIVETLAKISTKFSTDIKITPEVESFVKLLVYFENSHPEKKNLHLALSGYKTDAASAYVKYNYLTFLDTIKKTAEELSRGSSGGNALFKELADKITMLIKEIDRFNTTFNKVLTGVYFSRTANKYGGNEVSAQQVKLEEMPMNDSPSLIEQPYENAEILGGVISKMDNNNFKYFITLKKAIREMEYYIKISGIKASIQKNAEENKANAAKYEVILGEEAAFLINEIQAVYNATIASINGKIADMTDKRYNSEYNRYSLTKNGDAIYAWNGGVVPANLPISIQAAYQVINEPQRKNYIEGTIFILEFIRTAKIEMLEAAQALDLYLSKFTQNIEKNPDTIRNYVQILEQIEMVSKWYTDKSGDFMCAVFEAFPVLDATEAYYTSNLNGNDITTNHLNNIGNDLSQANFSLLGPNEHYYEYVKRRVNTGKPYLPRLMTKEQAYHFVKHVERAFKSVSALENLVSLFSKINTETTSEVKTFMSPARILKCFINYIIASSIGVGYKLFDKTRNVDGRLQLQAFSDAGRYLYQTCGITLKFVAPVPLTTYDLKLCDPLETPAEARLGYSLCDKIFEMCIKSMSAKIMTVLGTYSLFHRPVKTIDFFRSSNPAYSSHPLRQILGGASAYVDIDPKATELYIRLPLLVEWYRGVFDFVRTGPALNAEHDLTRQKDPLISLIPDFDSIWRDLVFTIFIEGVKIDDGGYPAEYAHKIINAITEIYNKYKSAKRDITCKQIIEEFVLEINRRYGFLLREEISTYLNERDEMIKTAPVNYDEEDRNQYDLLDSDQDLGRLPAPSDRFRTTANYNTRTRTTIDSFWNAVRRFRYSVEKNLLIDSLSGSSRSAYEDLSQVRSDVSLSNIVKNTQAKVNAAKTPEERYRLILGQLHGVERFSNVDQHKLILLHETVITPLTILYYVYLIMNDYNKLLISMNTEKLKEALTELVELQAANVHNDLRNSYKSLYDILQAPAQLDATIFNHNFVNNADVLPIHDSAPIPNFTGNPNTEYIQYNNLVPIAHLILPHLLLIKNNNNFKGNSKEQYGYSNTEEKNNVYNFKEGIACASEILKYFTCLLPVNYLVENASHINATQQNILRYYSPFTSREMPNFNGITTSHYIDSYRYLFTSKLDTIGDVNNYLKRLIHNDTVNTGSTRDNKIKFLERFALDEQKLFKDIMNKIMNLTTDLSGFVDVYFPSENKLRYITVNFDRLEHICTNMFQNLKQNLNNLRKSIPIELVDTIENNMRPSGSGQPQVNAVSLFYLQEHLFDRLFKNKYGNGLIDSNRALKNIWLHINKEYDYNLVDPTTFQFYKVSSIEDAPLANPNVNRETKDAFKSIGPAHMYQNTLNSALSSLLFWDVTGDYTSHNSVYANTHHMGHRYMNGLVKELGSFPSGYIPIFRTGASVNTPKTKEEKETYSVEMANGFSFAGKSDMDMVKLFNISNCIIKTNIDGLDSGIQNAEQLIFSGYRNLYDKAKYFHKNFIEESNISSRLTVGFVKDVAMGNLKEVKNNAASNNFMAAFKSYYDLNFEKQYPLSPYSVNKYSQLYAGGLPNQQLYYRNPYMHVFNDNNNRAQGKYVKWSSGYIGNPLNIYPGLEQENLRNYDQHPLNTFKVSYIYDPSQLGYRHIEKYYNPNMHANTLNGLLVQFNSLVHDYFMTFIDPSNKKIYKSIVEKFINAYNSKDILQGKNINDLVSFTDNLFEFNRVQKGLLNAAGFQFTRRGYFNTHRMYIDDDAIYNTVVVPPVSTVNNNVFSLLSGVLYQEPQKQATLFATLANAIKVLCTSKQERLGSSTVPQFIEDNFANVTELEKDTMRAYLPLFNKYLEIIAKKTEFIKQVIEQTSCKVYKPYQVSDQHLWYTDNNLKNQTITGNGDDNTVSTAVGNVPGEHPTITNQKVYLGSTSIGVLSRPTYGSVYNTDALILHDTVDPTFTQKNRVPVFENEASRKSYLIGISTDLIASVRSLQSCILATQKDLSDVPLFFETYKDSIASYYMRLQQYPFMPLSITTHLMNINNFRFTNETIESDTDFHHKSESKTRYDLLLTPSERAEGSGTVRFKMLYGTRGLLDHKQKPSIEYMPGMMQILDSEKMFGTKSGVVDKSNAQEFLNNAVPLTRFVLDQLYMMPYLTERDYGAVRNMTVANQYTLSKVNSPQSSANQSVLNLTCYTGKFNSKESPEYWQNTQNVIISVENDSLRQSVYRLIACMQQRGSNVLYEQDRNKMRIWNILDLNLVPINFHGLQREVPWANLLNYSYTFDHLIKDEIGITFKRVALSDIRGYKPLGVSDYGDDPSALVRPPRKRGGWQDFGNAVYDKQTDDYVYSSIDFNNTLFAEDQLVRQIIYPYGFRRAREYIRDTYRLMAGVNHMGLGRPKYLSDQLWNKVLFNNLFDNKKVPIERNTNVAREVATKTVNPEPQTTAQIKMKLISYFLENHQNELFKHDKSDLFIAHALHAAYSFVYANGGDVNAVNVSLMDIADKFEGYFNAAAANYAGNKIQLLFDDLGTIRVATRKTGANTDLHVGADTTFATNAGANVKMITTNLVFASYNQANYGNYFNGNSQILSLMHGASLLPNAFYEKIASAVAIAPADVPFNTVAIIAANAADLDAGAANVNAMYGDNGTAFNNAIVAVKFNPGGQFSVRKFLYMTLGKDTDAGVNLRAQDVLERKYIEHADILLKNNLYYRRWADPMGNDTDVNNFYAEIGGAAPIPAVANDQNYMFLIGLFNGILSAIDCVETPDDYDPANEFNEFLLAKIAGGHQFKRRFTREDYNRAITKLKLGFIGAKPPLIGAKNIISKMGGNDIAVLRPNINYFKPIVSNTSYLHYVAGTTYADFLGVTENENPVKVKNSTVDTFVFPKLSYNIGGGGDINGYQPVFGHFAANNRFLSTGGEPLKAEGDNKYVQGPTQQYLNVLALTSNNVDDELNKVLSTSEHIIDDPLLYENLLEALQRGINVFTDILNDNLHQQIKRNGNRYIEIDGVVNGGGLANEDSNESVKDYIRFGSAGKNLLAAIGAEIFMRNNSKTNDVNALGHIKTDLANKIMTYEPSTKMLPVFLLNRVFSYPSRQNRREIDLYARTYNMGSVPYKDANPVAAVQIRSSLVAAPYPLRGNSTDFDVANSYFEPNNLGVVQPHMDYGFVDRYNEWKNKKFLLNELGPILDKDYNPVFPLLAFKPDPQFGTSYDWTDMPASDTLKKKVEVLYNLIHADIGHAPGQSAVLKLQMNNADPWHLDDGGNKMKTVYKINANHNINKVMYLTNMLVVPYGIAGYNTNVKTIFTFANKPEYNGNANVLNNLINNNLYKDNTNFGMLGPLLTLQSNADLPCGELLYNKNCEPNGKNPIMQVDPDVTQLDYLKIITAIKDVQKEFLLDIQKGIEKKMYYNSFGISRKVNMDSFEPLMDDVLKESNIPSSILNHLSYIKKNQEVTSVITDPEQLKNLAYQGYLRYNTGLIRNTIWTVDIQRALRVNLRKELTWIQDPVSQKQDAVAEENDDYKDNNIYQIEDFE